MYESDARNMIAPPKESRNGGVKFTSSLSGAASGTSQKLDITILLLANPRAGSQLARKYITDYPEETNKLVV